MGTKRSGVLRRCSRMVLSCMQRPLLNGGLLDFPARRRIKMDNPCHSSECSTRDLTGRKAAWLLWYLPIILVIVGSTGVEGESGYGCQRLS